MHQTTMTNLDQRIKRFASRLKKDFAPEIAENPGSFKSRLIGKLKAVLPRKRPGRQGNPQMKKAVEIYQRDFKSQGKEGNWHHIAKEVFPDYGSLPIELQKYRRYQLRAGVHSHLYAVRSNERRNPAVRRSSNLAIT